jgi:Xaa-Pro aminopeptidase
VQTLQPTLRLGRDVWDRVAMPDAEFHDRVERLRAAMAGDTLDALLLYGRGLNQCGHPTYLANYIVKLPFAALVVLPRAGEPALIFEGATRGRDAATATTWIEDVRPCWNIASTCLTVVGERSLSAGRIGLAGLPRLMPYHEWRTLAGGLGGATLVEAEALVDRQRAVKSPRELAQMRHTSRLADLAMRSVTTAGPAAITESDLAARVIRDARIAGAEDVRLMIGRPLERDFAFRPPEARRLDPGDLFALHVAVSRERYWWEATRTYRARADAIEQVWTGDLDARFRGIVGAARPGATVRDIVNAARAALMPVEQQALEIVGLGHGIGVTPEEPPVLADADSGDIELAPGMCLVVRAALQAAGTLVVHGDTLVL